MESLSPAQAEALLERSGKAIVPAIGGSIPEMKKLRDRCLEVGVPAMVGCPPGGGKG